MAVSSLNPSKNFKLILETAKILPEINFVIAGGTNSNVFKEQGLEITSNVKFIGYVNDEELVALYKYASCFVYPLFMKVLEYRHWKQSILVVQ